MMTNIRFDKAPVGILFYSKKGEMVRRKGHYTTPTLIVQNLSHLENEIPSAASLNSRKINREETKLWQNNNLFS